MTTHLLNHAPAVHLPHSVPARLDLEAGAAWSATGPRRGVSIRCERGTVWVTVEGDPEDHVLAAPAVFETHRRGRVAAQALDRACIRVEPA